MIIDCDTCQVRGQACADCVVSCLLAAEPGPAAPGRSDPGGTDPGGTDPARTDPARTDPARTDPARTDPARTDWNEQERAAVAVLADFGLVPPLRLVPPKRAAG